MVQAAWAAFLECVSQGRPMLAACLAAVAVALPVSIAPRPGPRRLDCLPARGVASRARENDKKCAENDVGDRRVYFRP